jgi:sulfate permease, SulP family
VSSVLLPQGAAFVQPPTGNQVLQNGLLALGTVLPQTLALVAVAYAPLAALGLAPNPLWCLWSAIVGPLLMLALTRNSGVVYGMRPSAALLYGSTLAVCATLAPSLKLSALGTMGLTAACMSVAAATIWLCVRTGITRFARYLPLPVGRGLSLGFGLVIIWIQIKTVWGWFVVDGRLAFSAVAAAATVLVVLMVYLALQWRRDHPNKPYLLALLPAAAICVWVLESSTSIHFAWISIAQPTVWTDWLPPGLLPTFAAELGRADRVALLTTVLTVLAAQVLFVAFTFIVDSAGNSAVIEQLSGQRYDLNQELQASALTMALMPWLGLVPAASNLAATRPLYGQVRSNQRSVRLSNLVVTAGLLLVLGLAWIGVNRVPGLFVVAALLVIGLNLIDAQQLQRPDPAVGQREIWWQSWVIGAVFLFTSGIFAMVAGFAVAVAQFVRSAESSVVRSVYTLREMRSRKWRSVDEEVALRRVVTRAVVVVLQGTANFAVARRIGEEIGRVVQPNQVDVLLVDTQRVLHWDITALDAFKRLAEELQNANVALLISYLPTDARQMLADNTRLFNTTDRALEWAENEVLRRQGLGEALVGKPIKNIGQLPLFSAMEDDAKADLSRFGKLLTVLRGQQVFNVGDRDASLMVVLSGSVSIEVQGTTDVLRVATFTAGMVFGEMAFLDGSARSARAVAAEECVLFCLSRHGFRAWSLLHSEDAQLLLNALAFQMASRLRFATAQLIALNP